MVKKLQVKRQVMVGIVCLIALMIGEQAVAAQVEAKKDDVEVFDTPNKSGSVLKKLGKGEAVEAKERKGMFWEIALPDGKAGFVSVMAVKHKSAENDSNISSALREAVQEGRSDEDSANMRSRSAVMGVRGLDESGETAFAGNVKPNLRMVYSMENFLVKKDKVKELGSLVEKEINKQMAKKNR